VTALRPLATALWIAATTAAAGCGAVFGPEYEYEEQLYLQVDGSAEVVVDASFQAFAALRGLNFRAAEGGVDREAIRRDLEAGGCRVTDVSRPWERHGRPFIALTVAGHVRDLARCRLLSWSRYALESTPDGLRYTQRAGKAVGVPTDRSTWDGAERVAFKVHAPSRVTYQNVKILETGANGAVERGNILTWEQRLADRLGGAPVDMEIRMDSTSILNTTLWLFAGAAAAALLTMAMLVWRLRRAGRRPLAT
jgi:hypothetical protein